MRALSTTLLLLSAATACTLNNGRSTTELRVRLSASWTPAGLGTWVTALGYQVELNAAEFTTPGLRLSTSAAAATTGTGTFDEANPPPGCTLCHGGHCHCDGKLVSYEELAGGGAGSGAQATEYPGPALLNLQDPHEVELPVQPVPAGAWSALLLEPATLVLRGHVKSAGSAEWVPFRVEVPELTSAAFTQPGDLEVSAEREPIVVATLRLLLPDGLLDEVEFANLELRNHRRVLDATYAPGDVAAIRLLVSEDATATLDVSRKQDVRPVPLLDPALPSWEDLGLQGNPLRLLPHPDDDTYHPDAGPGPSPWAPFAVDGCEHLNDGPELGTVTAAATPAGLWTDGGAAARLQVKHGRTWVELHPIGNKYWGWLHLDHAKIRDDSVVWMVMQEEGVPVAIAHTGGGVVPEADLGRPDVPGNCGSQPRHIGHLWVFPLPTGGFVLTVGPSDTPGVSLVAVDSNDEEEE
ncbi:MAG: hypothetical protein HY904_18865 [Deltaproteobacteria bacterium]|nr:hypothetical protein [Deltaproteobacteria bacterium]